jgi:hypothetical protein
MEIVYAGFRALRLVVTLYSTDMLHLHYILLYIIYFKMACDEDMLPFECLICFRQFMTLDDLDCHVFETYGSLWHRFNNEIDFMPDFRRCLQCDVLDAVYEFADIADIMYHIQVVHPEVKREVSRRLINYWWD